MLYYLTNISNDNQIMDERNSIFSEAGKRRSEYLLTTIKDKVEIISLAIPQGKGFFKPKIDKSTVDLDYYFPLSINYFKLKHVSIMLSILWRLLLKVKKNDTILCYNANSMYVIPIIICKSLKRNRLIYEIEELYTEANLLKGFRKKIMAFTERYMINESDGYIIVNDNMRAKLNNNKPIILNFGYDNLGFKSDFSQDEDKLIVYTGRLDYEGGVEIFLESLEYIKHKVKVIITGRGPLKNKVSETTISNKNVEFQYIGFIDDEKLHDILCEASICINSLRLSNKFSDYSFPSKVLFYLSYGSIVVSSMSSGVLPLLDKFNNLYVYREDSSLALSEKIEEALNSKICKRANIENAISYFEEQKQALFEFWNKIYE